MSKKARHESRTTDKENTHIYIRCQKTDEVQTLKRIYGTMVTPKVYNAQVRNKNRARAKQGLPPIEETN